jgi:hypothetical protein
VTKSLLGTLAGMALLVGAMVLVLRKGPLGAALIVLTLALLVFGVSVLTGFFSGQKVRARDRHP